MRRPQIECVSHPQHNRHKHLLRYHQAMLVSSEIICAVIATLLAMVFIRWRLDPVSVKSALHAAQESPTSHRRTPLVIFHSDDRPLSSFSVVHWCVSVLQERWWCPSRRIRKGQSPLDLSPRRTGVIDTLSLRSTRFSRSPCSINGLSLSAEHAWMKSSASFLTHMLHSTRRHSRYDSHW